MHQVSVEYVKGYEKNILKTHRWKHTLYNEKKSETYAFCWKVNFLQFTEGILNFWVSMTVSIIEIGIFTK